MKSPAAFGGNLPLRQIRAVFDADNVIVYQAFSPEIAEPAVAAGRFVPPFKLDRMTWIKPSFLWMMYRSGWATKPGQERVLAVAITRDGFEWALSHSRFEPLRSCRLLQLRRVGQAEGRDTGADPVGSRALIAT